MKSGLTNIRIYIFYVLLTHSNNIIDGSRISRRSPEDAHLAVSSERKVNRNSSLGRNCVSRAILHKMLRRRHVGKKPVSM